MPRQARTLTEFAPVEEMLPLTQAVCRVFGKHGEKKNRNAARIKFLVDKWGIEKFREEVFAVRKELRPDPRWTDMVKDAEKMSEGPLKPRPWYRSGWFVAGGAVVITVATAVTVAVLSGGVDFDREVTIGD